MFQQRQRNQNYLIPVDIREALPENPLRDTVDEIVEKFFNLYGTSIVNRGNSSTGHPAIPSQVLTKVLLFSYLNGVYSSRQIEKKTQVDLEYIYLCEKYHISYRTIARFRQENEKLFKEVFIYFITVLKKLKMLNLLALFTDSTKIKANASDESYLTKDELQLYKELIEDAINMHKITDKEEEKLNKKIEKNVDRRSVGKMRKKVREMIKQIERDGKENIEEKIKDIEEKIRKVEKEELMGINLTDEDAVFMKNGKVITHSYNVETTVDENGFIVGADVVNNADDLGEGVKQLEQVKENLQLESLSGVIHAADGGFGSVDLLKYYEDNGIDGLVPQKTFIRGRYSLSSYTYDEEKDVFIAPDGVTIYRKKRTHEFENGVVRHVYVPDTLRKGQRKNIMVEDTFFIRERMRKKVDQNREKYKKRAKIIERIFGHLKHNKKFRMFNLRGNEKVKTETFLLYTAYNLARFCVLHLVK